MLDWALVRNKTISIADYAQQFTVADLRQQTRAMVNQMLALLETCQDADVIFVPVDLNAHDTFAANASELEIAWTLGHLIAHVTATAEEAAFIAAELARGVPSRGGRSRVEVPWRTITTVAQCRARLLESLRMRLATLEVWPDQPDLSNVYRIHESFPELNALTRFVFGLKHDDDHLAQIADVVNQARAARQ